MVKYLYNLKIGDNMSIEIKKYSSEFSLNAATIWNEVVKSGVAFPQTEILTAKQADEFFASQTYTGLAFDCDTNEIVGLYILHPNNVGRCAHICNASYAVSKDARGGGVGEQLVRHCIKCARESGFRILQFNAVVSTNKAALHLYEKIGFTKLGVIPGGFLLSDGTYEDIIPHYITL